MKSLHHLLIAFLLFYANVFFAQNQDGKRNTSIEYNLPPGAVLKNKFTPIDLSYKLENKAADGKYVESDLDVLKKLSKEELNTLKETDVEYYNYYVKGLSFFDGLSDKVKTIYSEKELWYIYVFDQKLKNKLTIIK